MFNFKYLAAAEMTAAALLGAVGLAGVATRHPLVLKWLYFFAWFSYIMFLDGLLFRLRGQSLLLPRPRSFLRLGFWSVTFWLLFEGLNLVVKNWGYAGVDPARWLRWPGYALAFATVLPGVFLTAEVLKALGAFRGRFSAPRNPGGWEPAALVAGTALLILPLIFPRYAFPLMWLALVPLLDPFCRLLGGRSLIAAWAGGERRETLCLLAAGLICGVWWEMWNWPSASRWVYTLPVLNFGKVFEMPILGYLGFAPFALECAVMYNFIEALEARVLTTRERRLWVYGAQVAFWLLMFAALDTWTVISFQGS